METVKAQPATLVTTPAGQPNVVEVPSAIPAIKESKTFVLQLQKSFLFSKTFWGNVAGICAALASVITLRETGHLSTLQDVLALFAVGGPLYGIYGRIMAQGPLGLKGTELVEHKEA